MRNIKIEQTLKNNCFADNWNARTYFFDCYKCHQFVTFFFLSDSTVIHLLALFGCLFNWTFPYVWTQCWPVLRWMSVTNGTCACLCRTCTSRHFTMFQRSSSKWFWLFFFCISRYRHHSAVCIGIRVYRWSASKHHTLRSSSHSFNIHVIWCYGLCFIETYIYLNVWWSHSLWTGLHIRQM